MCLIVAIIEPKFATMGNTLIILRNASVNAMIAFGMTFVILMGGIDLSVPGVMASAGMISTGVLQLLTGKSNLDPGNLGGVHAAGIIFVAIMAGLLVGLAVGFFNGFFSTKFKIAPFIVTLGTNYITGGVALLLTKGSVIAVRTPQFILMGTTLAGGVVPVQIVYLLIIFLVMFVILNNTKYGRRIFAIGGNEQAARYSGISADRIKISSFMILGVLAAFGGIITCARLQSGQPKIGTNAELDAIAAAILGGTSFTGGIGTLTGTLIGAIMLYVIQNGLNLMAVSQYWQPVAKGAVILIAVYVDVLKYTRRRKKRQTR
ncbi:MAG: ABC transporter permease [Treponema sp.]|nr:ABC transporter permease [Treponema sp.]